MSPLAVRRALHVGHAVTTVALVLTGLLIGHPELRGRLVGGFGREILEWHLWVGWAFLALPGLALVLSARLLLGNLARRRGLRTHPGAGERSTWRRACYSRCFSW